MYFTAIAWSSSWWNSRRLNSFSIQVWLFWTIFCLLCKPEFARYFCCCRFFNCEVMYWADSKTSFNCVVGKHDILFNEIKATLWLYQSSAAFTIPSIKHSLIPQRGMSRIIQLQNSCQWLSNNIWFHRELENFCNFKISDSNMHGIIFSYRIINRYFKRLLRISFRFCGCVLLQ